MSVSKQNDGLQLQTTHNTSKPVMLPALACSDQSMLKTKPLLLRCNVNAKPLCTQRQTQMSLSMPIPFTHIFACTCDQINKHQAPAMLPAPAHVPHSTLTPSMLLISLTQCKLKTQHVLHTQSKDPGDPASTTPLPHTPLHASAS